MAKHRQSEYVQPRHAHEEAAAPPSSAASSPLQDASATGHGFVLPPNTRPKYRFTVKNPPDPSRDPHSFTLAELTPDSHILAQQLSKDNKTRFAYELLKQSLYKVDGREVNHADDEATAYVHKWSFKFRQQALLCYAQVHHSSNAEDEVILGSMEPVAS